MLADESVGVEHLASLSTQSLNQFAESLSRVDALCAEIASIQRDLKGNAPTAELQLHRQSIFRSSTAKGKKWRRGYTPVRI